jgi:hypothetical protein
MSPPDRGHSHLLSFGMTVRFDELVGNGTERRGE